MNTNHKLFKRPAVGISKKCYKILDEGMVALQGNCPLTLLHRKFLLHNLINKSYQLGYERALKKYKIKQETVWSRILRYFSF
jgi:hypothetical protein